jgi:hypothetical protein
MRGSTRRDLKSERDKPRPGKGTQTGLGGDPKSLSLSRITQLPRSTPPHGKRLVNNRACSDKEARVASPECNRAPMGVNLLRATASDFQDVGGGQAARGVRASRGRLRLNL